MQNLLWIFWAVMGLVLIIAEIFTPGFVLLWFGVGALAAAFAGMSAWACPSSTRLLRRPVG